MRSRRLPNYSGNSPAAAPAWDLLGDDEKSGRLSTLLKLGPYLWPKGEAAAKLRIVLAIAAVVAGQVAVVMAPLLLETAVNRLSAADPALAVPGAIAAFVLGYGAMRLLGAAFPQLREWLFTAVGQRAQRRVAIDAFDHLHSLSLRFHLERRTGGLSRVIERGVKSIDFIFRFLLFNIGPTLIQLVIASIVFTTRYSAAFAVVACITVLGYVWFTVASTEWRLKFRREMNAKDTEANAKAVDSLLNYETVKYFNNERYESRRYNTSMEAYQDAAVRSNLSLALVNLGQALIFNIGLVLILLLAVNAYSAGAMGIGGITAVSLIMMNLYQPLNILGFAYREIKQSLVDMDKMFSLLSIRQEVEDKPDAPALNVGAGEIVFRDVCFRYEPDRLILNDVSFTAPAGARIAIVGHSGAGKSTISRILYRFYDIENGAVLIDGQDIRDVLQDSLRTAVGIVPQDTVLFNDTVRYNIAYAKPDATEDEIRAAAKLAQIDGFVRSLPKGYDTVVGERGLKLSGGEKQRVAIARTILKNPPILILDEATSALDSVTESEIQDALSAVAKDRTTLVIAHRLSTVVDADKIIVLDAGRIAEQGTHDELIAKNGEYAELWRRQSESHEEHGGAALTQAE